MFCNNSILTDKADPMKNVARIVFPSGESGRQSNGCNVISFHVQRVCKVSWKIVDKKKKRIQNDNLSPRKNGVVLKRQQPIPKVENNYPRSSPFHHPGQWEIKQNPVQPGLSAEPTINHSRLFPQIHLAASACASFSEGGQYVVRRRIDCLRGFTMKRRGIKREREGGSKKDELKRERRKRRKRTREGDGGKTTKGGESRVNRKG